jgi:hypothetical protein
MQVSEYQGSSCYRMVDYSCQAINALSRTAFRPLT